MIKWNRKRYSYTFLNTFNYSRYKFFVYSAYYDERIGTGTGSNRNQNGPGVIRVIGATKTRSPERVWCRLWYLIKNSDNATISITVVAKVKVLRSWLLLVEFIIQLFLHPLYIILKLYSYMYVSIRYIYYVFYDQYPYKLNLFLFLFICFYHIICIKEKVFI